MYKLILIILTLTACSNLDTKHKELNENIYQELNQAATVNNLKDNLEQALLPPINIPITSEKKTEQRFNLAVNNAPAREVLIGLAMGSQYDVLLHPEVTGNISISLKNVTLFEALERLRDIYGYDYQVEGKNIIVLPLTLQTRIFRVNYLVSKREGRSELRINSSLATNNQNNNGAEVNTAASNNNINSSQENNRVSDSSNNIVTSSKTDFWADLTQMISTLIGRDNGRNVVVNPQAGIIIVRAMPNELRDVANFLKIMKIAVERQVILEAKIISVTLNDGYQAGINWSGLTNFGDQSLVFGRASGSFSANANGTALKTYNANLDNTALTAGSEIFGLAFVHKNFKALLEFLQTQGQIQVLSSPRIATLNNQKAVLKIGTDEFFVTGFRESNTPVTIAGNSANSQTGGYPIPTLQPFFSGITLDVTPQIDEDNYVILHIHPSVSEVFSSNKTIELGNNGVLNLPVAKSSVNETDSIIRTRDGQIVAIGGLMSQVTNNERSQLPGVGEMPMVGELFRNTNQSFIKKELVILLKTTVVQDDNDWHQSIREYQQAITPN